MPQSQTNKNVLSSYVNCPNSLSACHKDTGRVFHTCWPTIEKLLSPVWYKPTWQCMC